MSTYLVTGAAGFIGYHVSARLLERGHEVVGLDNMNPYYSVQLKEARLARLTDCKNYRHVHADLADRGAMEAAFQEARPAVVINLAAQAGVRYSLTHPHVYGESNLIGFLNVLEQCRRHEVGHLVYASSSSVYGSNTKVPFSEHDVVDRPISLYAATKKANELMAHTYSHLYGIPTTGLRFFTVYGPWGRPDMSVSLFTEAIFAGKTIDVYNHGQMKRDFTYVDDIAEGVVRTAAAIPSPLVESGSSSTAPYRIYNIGNNQPVELLGMIEMLEAAIGRPAVKRMLPMQPGDVPATFADVDGLQAAVGFRPDTPLEIGLARFVEWYRRYHDV
ncbi:MAG: UDP-glucuronate 5-epimerase [Gemmatimonadetes bacterium]|nr:UDP-glucuronate 5-epimerase [Gemmatimonadota bacterium]